MLEGLKNCKGKSICHQAQIIVGMWMVSNTLWHFNGRTIGMFLLEIIKQIKAAYLIDIRLFYCSIN